LQGGSGADTFDVSANDTAAVQPIQALRGGAGADTFNVKSGGKLSATVDGQADSDALNYSGNVAVFLTRADGTGYAGHDTLAYTGGFGGIDSLSAAGASDTLTGENVASTWRLGSSQTYSAGGSGGGAVVASQAAAGGVVPSSSLLTFSGFETLQGGAD